MAQSMDHRPLASDVVASDDEGSALLWRTTTTKGRSVAERVKEREPYDDAVKGDPRKPR